MTSSRRVSQKRQPTLLDSIGVEDGAVYELLVAHPRSSAAELANCAELSPRQVALALSRLASAGLAHRNPGRPPRYAAGPPEQVLGPLFEDRERELRQARTELQRLAGVHHRASRAAHPADLVEVLMGNDTIHARVRRVQADAREEILGLDRAPYLRKPGSNLEPELQRLREGVRFRVIYDRTAVGIPGRLENDILPSIALHEKARVRDTLPMKMFVGDRRTAVIPIESGSGAADAAYVVHPCALLDALLALFEAEWERATPITHNGIGRRRKGPPEGTERLLPLLAAGHTDDSIARALGWSARTAQRRVQKLMADLGATTRFQAGLAAKERGWL